MLNEEEMTINERRKYLRLIKKRYLKPGKLERGRPYGEDAFQLIFLLAIDATIDSISKGCFRTVMPSMFLILSTLSTSIFRVVIVIFFPPGTSVSRLPSFWSTG